MFGRKNKKNLDGKKVINSGFGENVSYEGSRLINKNGQFNIQKKGLSFFKRFSLFHWMIDMSWLNFFGIMFVFYISINMLFASGYFIIGIKSIKGASSISDINYFMDCFYFSAQTLTTVGYGTISPQGWGSNILSIIESFVGLMSFAFATGLLYGRFSKPNPNLIFSQIALIAPYINDKNGLMIRVANATSTQIIKLSANLLVSWIEEVEGAKKRKFYNLDLEINKINMLAASWTIVHPINTESPFYDLTESDMEERNMEIILQLDGYDETLAQQVHIQTSYKYNELIWNGKFKTILHQDDHGRSIAQLDELGDYELLD